MISNLSLMHNVHEDLLRVFIDLIGFTAERISNFIISRHCCGSVFGRNFEQNEPQRYLNFYHAVPFGSHLGSVASFYLRVFLVFPKKTERHSQNVTL